MTKIHIISDLFLKFNEFSPDEETIPDVDLVVINGNIGHMKRSMLYAEVLCKKYPDTQFVYNLGESELHRVLPKYVGEVQDAMMVRRDNNPSWPKNLHYSRDPMIIKCRNGYLFDVLCTYGFPKVHDFQGKWEDTRWYRYYISRILDDDVPEGKWYKPDATSNVRHGHVPEHASMEWINEQHELESAKAKSWELNPTYHKLLVTHINPFNDTRYQGQNVSPYRIHLERGLWVTANTKCNGVNYLGSRLYSNPGRQPARQHVIEV